MSEFDLVADIDQRNLRRKMLREIVVEEGVEIDVGTKACREHATPIEVTNPYPRVHLPQAQLQDGTPGQPTRSLEESIGRLLFPELVQPGEAKAKILLTNDSSIAAVRLALQTFHAEGKKVVLPAPYFFSFPEMIKVAGGEPVAVATDPDNGYKLTADILENTVREQGLKPGDLVLLTAPSNLLPEAYTQPEMEAIAKVMVRHGLKAVCDEMHAHISSPAHVSLASLTVKDDGGHDHKMEQDVITVSGGSKQFGCTSGDIDDYTHRKFGVLCASPDIIASIPKTSPEIMRSFPRRSAIARVLATLPDNYRRSHWRAVDMAQTIFTGAMRDVNRDAPPPFIMHTNEHSYFACLELNDTLCKKLGITNGDELSEYLLATTRVSTTGLALFGEQRPIVRVNVVEATDEINDIRDRFKALVAEINAGTAPSYAQVKATIDPLIDAQIAAKGLGTGAGKWA